MNLCMMVLVAFLNKFNHTEVERGWTMQCHRTPVKTWFSGKDNTTYLSITEGISIKLALKKERRVYPIGKCELGNKIYNVFEYTVKNEEF